MKKSLDFLILFVLVTARVRIDTLADATLPQRYEHVRQWVAGWWPAWSLDLLTQPHPENDPVTTVLIATAIGLLVLYGLVDALENEQRARFSHQLKLVLIYGIIGLLIFAKTILFINLRQIGGPLSYAHDGGVIQTEVTVDYLLRGLNPYVEDYVETPMAEWGFPEYRTALYHYPYLPWTFLFSAPIYLLSQATLGWFDQRLVYLPLFVLALVLTQRLVQRPQAQRIALMTLGLNPLLGISVIFGENDPFVLAWLVLALWLLTLSERWGAWLGSAAFGLACASKPTAWFLIPFWLLYLGRDRWGERLIPPFSRWQELLLMLLRRAWPLPAVALLVIGPWFVWNPEAMYDDVWRWSAGLGPTGYQIWGWGASNYALVFGWVSSRFDYWPFIVPSLLVSLPLLLLLLWRQLKNNTMATMLYSYVVFLLAFFYLSRFLQPNYLGYLLGFLTLAITIEENEVMGN